MGKLTAVSRNLYVYMICFFFAVFVPFIRRAVNSAERKKHSKKELWSDFVMDQRLFGQGGTPKGSSEAR